ncbi:papain-like cysteine protease family protein [Bradyrhizobium sp. JYMT SZCCT0428]|uniref:papain-like cysteine protease family protein n=1 Tax=Bradyrhizobium sp. JYMT SZCCT0428 TaxID=2807673 RepID=UPI001BA46758|nr:papain-like cysteine protease family protein [Bradyrhizobium sp. JYMT SZCCT0428]MBR1155225.1 hypothetical protein [Bradyrhizobium sp. JYMT SZCCT0428]
MMLNVTFYGQTTKLPNGPPKEDPTGCWYACAKMIGMYWDGSAQRIGVPELNNEDGTHRLLTEVGGGWTGEGRLAKNERLVSDLPQDFTRISEVEIALNKWGPILFFMSLPAPASGENMVVGHCGVIVGTSVETIVYHDPAYGPSRQMSLSLLRLARSAVGPTKMWARDPASTIKLKRHVESENPRSIESPGASLAADHYVSKLIGTWELEIGADFKGFVTFEGKFPGKSGKAYWMDSKKMAVKHPGSWKSLGGTEISFEFDDDTPKWKRLWKVKIDAKISVGNVTIGGVPHGFFKLIYNRV